MLSTLRSRLGLRTQVIVLLLASFVVAFFLIWGALQRKDELEAQMLARRINSLLKLQAGEPIEEEELRKGGLEGVAYLGKNRKEYWGNLTRYPTTYHFADHELILSYRDTGRGSTFLSLYLVMISMFTLLLLYVFLTVLIVIPISQLRKTADRMTTNLDARASVQHSSEMYALSRSLNDLASALGEKQKLQLEQVIHLEKTAKELRDTQVSLVRNEKLASVGRLAAGLAHEIGNPLTGIKGLVEVLEMGVGDAKKEKEFLGRIHRETDRIHRIIRGLLDFARGETETLNHKEAACADAASAIENAVHLVIPQKDVHAITIQRRIEEHLPRVNVSFDSLTQVMLNLLLNAADALASGEPEDKHIDIDAHAMEEEKMVKITVTDSGTGIEEQVMEKLFEPFSTTKPPGQGTGLGLAVCHRLITQCGGSIGAENVIEQGQVRGARFTLLLPYSIPS